MNHKIIYNPIAKPAGFGCGCELGQTKVMQQTELNRSGLNPGRHTQSNGVLIDLTNRAVFQSI